MHNFLVGLVFMAIVILPTIVATRAAAADAE